MFLRRSAVMLRYDWLVFCSCDWCLFRRSLLAVKQIRHLFHFSQLAHEVTDLVNVAIKDQIVSL